MTILNSKFYFLLLKVLSLQQTKANIHQDFFQFPKASLSRQSNELPQPHQDLVLDAHLCILPSLDKFHSLQFRLFQLYIDNPEELLKLLHF